MSFTVRPMCRTDIDEVLRIQALAYAQSALLLEDEHFFLNRLRLSPQTCWVADASERLLGYLVSYPWTRQLPPALNQPLEALPVRADSWFLHDCAIDPEAQGQGVASRLLRHARQYAADLGLEHASLVSLGSACGYWRKQGYRSIGSDDDEVLKDKLDEYGQGARYMVCPL